MADKKYNIILTAADQTRAAFDSAKRNVQDMEAPLLSVRNAFNAVASSAVATAVIAFGRAAINAAEEAEQAQLKLQAVYKATGGVVGFTATELNRMAEAMANTTHFDDEAIRNGMSEIIKFGSITGAVFKDSLKVIADYATFSGQAFPEAASAVAKALADPETAAKLLKQAGVVLTDSQKELIKTLKETGQEAEAQRVILNRLQGTFAGMEESLNSGLTGATKSLGNEWNELLETLGKSSGSVGAANLTMGSLSFAIKSVRDMIQETDDQYKKSLLFRGGKGELKLTSLGPGDTGPLRGKTLADVQAANAAIAHQQEVAAAAEEKHLQEKEKKAAEAEKKRLEAGEKQTIALHNQQLQRFTALRQAAEDADATELQRDQLKLDRQLNDLALQRMITATNHTLTLAEERAFGQAESDIIEVYMSARRDKKQKELEAHDKQTTDLVNKQSERFAALRQSAEEADATDAERAQMKVERQLSELEIQRMILATDHDLTLEEIARFEQAKADIRQAGADRQLAVSETFHMTQAQFARLSTAAQTKTLAEGMMQQLAIAGTQYRAAFELSKAARTAQAVISGWKAVQDAYAFGSEWGGPFGGAAMAAIAAMATAANVSAIQSAQFGGGTGAYGAGGGGGGAPVTTPSPLAPSQSSGAQASTRTPIVISINLGNAGFLPASAVRDLISQINEQILDGTTLVTT